MRNGWQAFVCLGAAWPGLALAAEGAAVASSAPRATLRIGGAGVCVEAAAPAPVASAAPMAQEVPLERLRQQAKQGDDDAALQLAHRLGIPRDAARNADEVIAIYRRVYEARGRGAATAATNLGLVCLDGRGVPKDLAQAEAWLIRAAELGAPAYQYGLGRAYTDGNFGRVDNDAAVRWIRASADQDHAVAQWFMGTMYARGVGVKTDLEEAARWYRLAANQGNSDAQLALGEAYEQGAGRPRDAGLARGWYLKAAAQGHPQAMYKAALAYRAMQPPADAEADTCLLRAAFRYHHPDAMRALDARSRQARSP